MNLLADESVDRQVVERLRQDGYAVLYIAELEPSIPDDVVLKRANETAALLITADKDFGELVFRKGRAVEILISRRRLHRPNNRVHARARSAMFPQQSGSLRR